MNIAVQTPAMTREAFFAWAQLQGARYEFDGLRPVAMTGGSNNHSRTSQNIYFALRSRLQGSACQAFGPDAGLATTGNAVRYPDALVTCSKVPGAGYVVPGVVVVFEVLSPTSGRTDRIEKLREYRAVTSIRRYVVVEFASIGLTVFSRPGGADDWVATSLTGDDVLDLPEIGIQIPVGEFYELVDLPGTPDQAGEG